MFPPWAMPGYRQGSALGGTNVPIPRGRDRSRPCTGSERVTPVSSGPVDVRGITIAPRARIWPPLITLWIIWGSTYLGIAVVAKSMPAFLSMGLRFIAAAAVLGLTLAIVKGPSVLRVSLPGLAYSALMGSILLGLIIGNLTLAERHVPSGIAALIVAVNPLWIVLFRFRAGERPPRLTLIGVAVGMTGLLLMLLPGGTKPVSGSTDVEVVLWSLTIIAGAFVWAAVSWRSARWPMPSNALVATFYELLAGGLCALGVGAVIGERFDFAAGYPTDAWIGWAWLVVASVIGYGSYSWLIANAPMSLVATYAYVNPMVAVILGSVVIGEAITRDVVLGLTIVLGGVVLVIGGERKLRAIPEG